MKTPKTLNHEGTEYVALQITKDDVVYVPIHLWKNNLQMFIHHLPGNTLPEIAELTFTFNNEN